MTYWDDVRPCWTLEKEPGFPGHCQSCHEDEDKYNYTLLGGYDTSDGKELNVCCWVHTWLTELGRVSYVLPR